MLTLFQKETNHHITMDRFLGNRPQKSLIAALIAKSSRTTYPGRLLDVILSNPPKDIFWGLSIEYWGYTRGLTAFIKIIETENARLWVSAKPDEVESLLYYGLDDTVIEALCFTIGAMNTRESHATLLRFMDESYHPRVRGVAVEGMCQERTMFDKRLVLDILHGDLPIVMRWEAIYSAECNLSKFTTKEYVLAIAPYLYHDDHNVRLLATGALSRKWAGRNILRAYREQLHTGQIKTSWQNEIKEIEKSLEFYQEEDARREARRRANNES